VYLIRNYVSLNYVSISIANLGRVDNVRVPLEVAFLFLLQNLGD
jgi:hypothetical protein